MPSMTQADAPGLCNFVDMSPSPFHVCATVAAALNDAGFTELDESQRWPSEPGRYFLVRGGSLVASIYTADDAVAFDRKVDAATFRLGAGIGFKLF